LGQLRMTCIRMLRMPMSATTMIGDHGSTSCTSEHTNERDEIRISADAHTVDGLRKPNERAFELDGDRFGPAYYPCEP